ncbi:TauD/TfdA family dioxygenase [Uruburuella testudinis]|uniref:TauD/TfdA family dioxygenase n=1 Tax=Uruburuella testudinis TaxID=1282863 RepID=A0ABY4DWP8_9NEIS|nr:TauD/TfdA family dioxygenase [Uruburuella testudinis]UOO82032.1 TauD/TfdA family dioxygenase [Uruburuella testudinis]
MLSDLTAEDLQLLQEPYYTITRPASFQESQSLNRLPLLVRQSNGSYHSRFDYHHVSSFSPRHEAALMHFRKQALNKDKWKDLYLKPGQAVTFNNQTTLHTRNGFRPKFDGQDRWLLRVFGLYERPQQQYLLSPVCNHPLKTI